MTKYKTTREQLGRVIDNYIIEKSDYMIVEDGYVISKMKDIYYYFLDTNINHSFTHVVDTSWFDKTFITLKNEDYTFYSGRDQITKYKIPRINLNKTANQNYINVDFYNKPLRGEFNIETIKSNYDCFEIGDVSKMNLKLDEEQSNIVNHIVNKFYCSKYMKSCMTISENDTSYNIVTDKEHISILKKS